LGERLAFEELCAERPHDIAIEQGEGWELLTFCHKHCPEIPVMIISGEGLGKRPEIERWPTADGSAMKS
jgi:hypothetical protein